MSNLEVTHVGTINPEEMRNNLTNRDSRFFRTTGLLYDDPLVDRLRAILAGGDQESSEYNNRHTLSELRLTTDDLRRIGRGAYNLYLKVTTQDEHGRPLVLDATEFISWQGTTEAARANAEPGVTADVWAQHQTVNLKSRPIEYQRGDTEIFIETPEASRRAVRGGDLTEPFGGNYGYQRIIDRDHNSPGYGRPLLVGGDGELDIWAPNQVLENMQRGTPYTGNVIIQSYNEGARADAKACYYPSVRELMISQSASVAGERQNYHRVAGVDFPEGIELPLNYVRELEKQGANTNFFTLSQSQFRAWQFALSEHAEIRNMRPETWINQTFGSMERFNEIFQNAPTNLTREQYHQLLPHDVDVVGMRVSLALRQHGAASAAAVESFLRSQDVQPHEGIAFDGRLTDAEATSALSALDRIKNNPEQLAAFNEQLRAASVTDSGGRTPPHLPGIINQPIAEPGRRH